MPAWTRRRFGWILLGAMAVVAAILVGSVLSLVRRNDPRVAALFAPSRTILVPAEIGSVKRLYILDTGSEGTLVTPEIGALLRPTGKTHRVSSSLFCMEPHESEVYLAGEIHFAGHRLLYPQEVETMDLASLGARLHHVPGGILGWDVLRNYVIGIDFSRRRVLASRRLAAADVLKRLRVFGPATELRLEHEGNSPSVTVRTDGYELHLRLDTGASTTTIFSPTWQRMNKAISSDGPTTMVLTIDGPLRVQHGQLDVLWLGSLRMDHVTVGIPAPKNCDEAEGNALDGLLGLDVLSAYLTVIDGPTGVLYLARPPAEDGDATSN